MNGKMSEASVSDTATFTDLLNAEFPLDYQSIKDVENKEGVLRLGRSPAFMYDGFKVPKNMRTLYTALHRIAKIFPNRLGFAQRTCLSDGRPGGYESFSYRQALHKVKRLAIGLATIGCTTGTHIAVLSPSTFSWLLLDFAASAIGSVLIPLYDNWTVDTLNYVVDHCDATVLVIHPSISGKMNLALRGKVKTLVVMDLDDRGRRWADNNSCLFVKDEGCLLASINTTPNTDTETQTNTNIPLYTNSISPADAFRISLELVQHGTVVERMSHLLEEGGAQGTKHPGHKMPAMPLCSKANDVHTIVYTSGTSGTPKGAMLTELSLMQSAFAMLCHGAYGAGPSFLPQRKEHKATDPLFIPKPDHIATVETYRIHSDDISAELVNAMTDSYLGREMKGKRGIGAGGNTSSLSLTPPPPSYLCMLPLAHVFERTTTLTALLFLTRIHFLSGYNYDYDVARPTVVPRYNNVGSMIKDISSVSPGPSVLVTVPRLLEKIKESVEAQMVGDSDGDKGKKGFKSFIKSIKAKTKQLLLRTAVTHQLSCFHKTGIISNRWTALVLCHIRALLGSELKLVIVGGSAISKDVTNFFKALFDAHVAYGYGMTETAGCITASEPSKQLISGANGQGCSVGLNLIELQDRQDLAYTKELNTAGEVLVAGVPLFRGYYKDEKATKQAFVMREVSVGTREGVRDAVKSVKIPFYRTGDIGVRLDDGSLLLVDRANNIFKLSQGEFVVADRLEAAYVGGLVAQLVVAGGSTRSEIVAVAVVDKKLLAKALAALARVEGKEGKEGAEAETGMETAKEKELEITDETLNSHRVRSLLFADLLKKAERAKLVGYEMVRGCIFTFDEFTVQNGMLTASMKIRRNEVIKRYADYIDAIYDARAVASAPGDDGNDVSIFGSHDIKCHLLTHRGRVLISASKPMPEMKEEVFAKK